MSYGLGYDSEEGRALAGGITALMTGCAYEHSAELARQLGPFPGYHDARCPTVPQPLEPSNEQSMLEVIQLHRDAVEQITDEERFAGLKTEARKAWDAALRKGRRHGFRNAQVTVLAPTGTIGFFMDCDTTGIEPDIALVKYKYLAGGGMLKIVNRIVEPALHSLGYAEEEIRAIIAHIDRYDTIEDVTDEETGETIHSGLKPEHLGVFDCAFRPARGRRSLHYLAHIRMMAAAQPFLSGAISKTVNMPNDATVEDIMNTYLEGWKLGLKAIAIYRDGSKRSAPLATKKTRAAENSSLEEQLEALKAEVASLREQAGKPLRRRLPTTRMAVNHKFHIAGHEGYLTVGLFADGQPGELFITMAKEGSTIGGAMDTVATLTSLALQYGVPLEALVRKFSHQHYEPSGFTKNPMIPRASSITDYIFRWLGHQFIPGYSEAHRPENAQLDLPLPGLIEELQKHINRPSPELPLSDETTIMLKPEETESAARPGNGNGKSPASGPADAPPLQGFVNQLDAPVCSNCGHVMVRNGACYKCLNCGESNGCS
jgi:ribonucleoside-diphosphate reductase alpha chain